MGAAEVELNNIKTRLKYSGAFNHQALTSLVNKVETRQEEENAGTILRATNIPF